MKALEEKYLTYIEGKIVEHKRMSEQYKADDRKDEADLEKIKVNIYEVFRTLFISDIKQLEGKSSDEAKDISTYTGFMKRFDTIPANWRISLDKAIEYNDTTKQVIEENKLAVAEGLKQTFMKMFD